jgi:hypothetical protein
MPRDVVTQISRRIPWHLEFVMKCIHWRRLSVALAGLIAAYVAIESHAQSSGGKFSIDHVTVTGGGTLSGGAFGLKGTFGQPIAGNSSGGSFAIEAGARLSTDSIFSSGFESQ